MDFVIISRPKDRRFMVITENANPRRGSTLHLHNWLPLFTSNQGRCHHRSWRGHAPPPFSNFSVFTELTTYFPMHWHPPPFKFVAPPLQPISLYVLSVLPVLARKQMVTKRRSIMIVTKLGFNCEILELCRHLVRSVVIRSIRPELCSSGNMGL